MTITMCITDFNLYIPTVHEGDVEVRRAKTNKRAVQVSREVVESPFVHMPKKKQASAYLSEVRQTHIQYKTL